MDEDEKIRCWEAFYRAYPVMLDRQTKRLDIDFDGGSMSLYWVGDVLRVDLKFDKTPEPLKQPKQNWWRGEESSK